MRILSLDLGIKSLGICVSDSENLIAIPVENFVFRNKEFNIATEKVLELVDKFNIGTIILGYPKRTDGIKSEMTYYVDEFYEKLKKILSNIKIKLFDERFTTKRGIELLKLKYNDKEQIHKYKDMAAAYVMLIDYLSYINNKS